MAHVLKQVNKFTIKPCEPTSQFHAMLLKQSLMYLTLTYSLQKIKHGHRIRGFLGLLPPCSVVVG